MNNTKKEDGYVLVVIIGILTILSLMAITFATLSRIETRATRNYSDSVKCEMVAKAGLEHAIYVLRLDKFGTDTTAYNNDNGDENYDWSGETWMPGGGDFSGTDYDNDGDTTNDSQWIYFPLTAIAGTSTTAIRLPGNLLARYAVLITDDREARLNINVTGNKAGGGSHTSNEGWSTFENDLSFSIEQAPGLNSTDGNNIANDIIDTRLGSDDAPGTSATNDDTGIVPNPQSDKIDNDGDWITANDTNGNGIPDSGETGVDDGDNSESIDEPSEFNSIFPYGDDVPFGLLSETEIMGTSSYTSRLETIFNQWSVSESDQNSLNNWLTTYSVDTILCPPYQLDGGTSTTMLNINTLVNNEGAYTATGTYDSDKKAKMLVDVLTAGGVPDVERQQMAVNIIDFVDSNGTVTAYNDGSNTYYGVERTPYINEVEAEVDGTSGGWGKFIELFNPYDTPLPIENWKIEFGTTTITLPPSATIPKQGYYVIADDATAYQTFDYNPGKPPDWNNPNINSLNPPEEIILKDSNDVIIQKTTYGLASYDKRTSQLNDPRPTPLDASPSDPWLWTTTSMQTAGGTNTAFLSVGNDDGWDNTTWPNSFLVANRRFTNKGYLGFIHRGSQWSSFKVDDSIAYPNVLQYFTITDPSMDGIDNDGDFGTDTYDTDGDGDIDANDTGDTGFQTGDIYGKEYRIPGLINVNTASNQVLQSLPNIGTSEANAIINNRPFKSIGEVANVFTGISGNKCEREKTFRSISNLITTRSNVFTVYVTAQIIKEEDLSEVAEKKIMAIVDRSVNPIKIRYFRWITE